VEKWCGEIQRELDGFRSSTSADFVALAWISDDDHRMRWRMASGSRSERYRTLPVRPGRELAGTVYRIGRTLAWDGSTPDLGRKRLESPLMMAEELKAAAASPVFCDSDIQGIVLAGQRSDRVLLPRRPARPRKAVRTAEAARRRGGMPGKRRPWYDGIGQFG